MKNGRYRHRISVTNKSQIMPQIVNTFKRYALICRHFRFGSLYKELCLTGQKESLGRKAHKQKSTVFLGRCVR